MSKIVSQHELLQRAGQARAEGKTLVHCHGCFDIVHPGHIRYLEFARRQGDLLVVSITGDAAIAKGDQRPYIPQELRAESLAALEAVDLVYLDPNPTARELLEALRPEFYVKGREYEHRRDPGFAAEREVVASYGGRVLFSSGDVVFSSSRLIESLSEDRALADARLALWCGRNGIDRDATETLLASFGKLQILVIGDVVLDRYALCDATELAGEAAMMSLQRLEDQVYVGGAGVVARHLAGLGATAYLLSSSADDEAAAAADHVLEQDGVRTRMIRCRSRLPERTRFIVDTQKVLRVEDGQSQPLDSVALRDAARWVASIAPQIDGVIFCDH